MEDNLHKHSEGAYNVLFFDHHGRHIKEEDVIKTNLTSSIDYGKLKKTSDDNINSFLVKRNIYNSIDRQGN